MTEENNNKMMVYAVELIKGENVAIIILGDLEPDTFTLICDNFIIAKCGEEGETIGITKEEANDLATFLRENTIKLKQAYDKGLFGGKKIA